MKRIYHRYELWECHKHKMYDDEIDENSIKCSYDILRNLEVLKDGMWYVSKHWVYSAENFLSNKARNRQAYLGQAACCWLVHSSEKTTKEAWNRLTDDERQKANDVADSILLEWDAEFNKKYG